jgi:hypothetical protein
VWFPRTRRQWRPRLFPRGVEPTVGAVGTTYAVKWREPDGRSYIGRLELGAGGLALEGRGSDVPIARRRLRYEEVEFVRTGSRALDRLDGRPTLVVDASEGRYLIAGAAMSAGVVQELVERLAELSPNPREGG